MNTCITLIQDVNEIKGKTHIAIHPFGQTLLHQGRETVISRKNITDNDWNILDYMHKRVMFFKTTVLKVLSSYKIKRKYVCAQTS